MRPTPTYPSTHLPTPGRRSHFERYRCDVYLDDEPSVPPPPRREWAEVHGGAGGQLQPQPRPLRFDGPCWLRGVPNAALCRGTLLSNGVANGIANGVANGVANGFANGSANGSAAAASGASTLPAATAATAVTAATAITAVTATAAVPPPQWLADLEYAARTAGLLIEAKPSVAADCMDLLLIRPQGVGMRCSAGERDATVWRLPYVAAFHESATARLPLS